jgi:hypothetical protein
MRISPSGSTIPNEIVRYSFPLDTASAGKVVAPLWSMPGVAVVDTSTLPGLVTTPFACLPGRLDLASRSVVSGGGNVGSKIGLQWMATTTLLPSPSGAPVPDFIDPTQPAGVVTRQFNFKDVIIPNSGAAIAPFLSVPADFVGSLYVLFSVAVFWRESKIRGKLG